MAKKANQFRNLKELEKFIHNNAPNIILRDGNVERVLKSAMNQAIYETVYGAYVPKVYERRGRDGGLADTRLMMITEAIMKNGKFEVIFENLAKGNDNLSGEYLVDTIEEGIKENWENSKGVWAEARPFVHDTYLKLMQNPEPLIEAVKKAFIKLGFKVK